MSVKESIKSELKENEDTDSSSLVLSTLLLDQLNLQDVNALLESQSQIINRLDKTNQNLSSFNKHSMETFNSFAVKDYQSYISVLMKMKTDLDYIFKHIRIVKSKLQDKYPGHFENYILDLDEGEEDDENDEAPNNNEVDK